MKGSDYLTHTDEVSAFVSTNSICQGQQVPILWPLIFETGNEIVFAHTSFKWANLASHNAGVTTVIVGISPNQKTTKRLFGTNKDGEISARTVDNINAYLVPGIDVVVDKKSLPISSLDQMDFGSKPVDGGAFFMDRTEFANLLLSEPNAALLIAKYSNSNEFINGIMRYCLWINDDKLSVAREIAAISGRLDEIAAMRMDSSKRQTKEAAATPHRFAEIRHQRSDHTLVVPRVSSENRLFLPVGILEGDTIIGDRNFALYDAPLWNMALIASRLHWVWIGTVCVRMRTDFSYSNTLGWNTFPVPKLTTQHKEDLTQAAENILLAREAHFPATIADLYKPDEMPDNLRAAHDENDRILEEIYIGRRFKNDTERLEKLFEMYTEMTNNKTNQ